MRRKTVFYKAQEGDGRRNATRNCTPRGGAPHHGTHRPHGDNTDTPPPPQAHADNAKTEQTPTDGNIEISVPTSVPCLVKADGTIIAPTAETWKIRNDSTQPVTLDTAVADTITPGTSITAKSQPTTLYEDDTQNGKGSYTIAIDDTGNEKKA